MTEHSRRSAMRLGVAGFLALPMMAAGTRPARAATHNVEIRGFAFNPAQLTVAAGDSVVFSNRDGTSHTATARDGSFDTGTIRRGKAVAVTAGAAGTHAYFCRFHPRMKGTLTVG